MIKRPLNPRFSEAVLQCLKTTTIRPNPWPIDKPIMLYNWAGKPYRSKQVDVAPVIVGFVSPIRIERHVEMSDVTTAHGMRYLIEKDWMSVFSSKLCDTEGFTSFDDMDKWFMQLVKPGKHIDQHIMHFRLYGLNN